MVKILFIDRSAPAPPHYTTIVRCSAQILRVPFGLRARRTVAARCHHGSAWRPISSSLPSRTFHSTTVPVHARQPSPFARHDTRQAEKLMTPLTHAAVAAASDTHTHTHTHTHTRTKTPNTSGSRTHARLARWHKSGKDSQMVCRHDHMTCLLLCRNPRLALIHSPQSPTVAAAAASWPR